MYRVKVEWLNESNEAFTIEGTIPELPSPGKLFLVTCPHYNGLPKQFIEMELGFVEKINSLHHVYTILTRENCYDMTILEFSGPMPINVVNLQAYKNKGKVQKMVKMLKNFPQGSDTLH